MIFNRLLKNRVVKNASWIIVCRIIQSLLTLVVGMLSARYLGPSNYGLINYAASIVAFVVPVMQLGLNSTIVQELVNNPDDEGEIVGSMLLLTFFSSFLCMVGVVSFSLIVNAGETETIIVCALYSISLAFQSIEMIQYWFQAKYLSKYTSIVSLVAYFIVSGYKIFLLATGKSVFWFAISYSIDYAIIAFVLLYFYFRLGGSKLKFSLTVAKKMFSKSHYYIVSSLMVTIFAQTDRIMLKLMLSDAATGYYTAATSCVGITSFVYSAIVDSARPSILESVNKGESVFEKNISRLYCLITYICIAQCILTCLLAKPMILILYGNQYGESISALRIVVWYSTFSYYGVVRNIWILAENKQKYLWIINLLGALSNVILNAILIPTFGVNGAALASLITQFFTNVITGFIIRPIRRNNTLIYKGLNPKLLIELIKS